MVLMMKDNGNDTPSRVVRELRLHAAIIIQPRYTLTCSEGTQIAVSLCRASPDTPSRVVREHSERPDVP